MGYLHSAAKMVSRKLACTLMILIAVCLAPLAARAQIQSLPDILDQLKQSSGGGPVQEPSDLDRAREGASEPGSLEERLRENAQDRKILQRQREKPSPLEDFYQTGLKSITPPDSKPPELKQFGYDIFDTEVRRELTLSGAISDDYVLDVGDKLVITLRGPQSKSITTQIDREGLVILPDMRPIKAANRTFSEFREEFNAEVTRSFVGTEAYVSLGALRAISVLVLGEVKEPGQKQLTSLSTVFDALQRSAGIRKSGSLRRISVSRADEKFDIDLYDLIQRSDFNGNIRLRDGDRISVSAIGGTFAVAGLVNRPGVYELPGGRGEIPFREAMSLAAGSILPDGTIFIQITSDDVGRRFVLEADPRTARVKPGDTIFARPSVDARLGGVTLTGHVKISGIRSIFTTPTVASLVSSIGVLGDSPYTGLAVLRRTGESGFTPAYHAVNLQKVLQREVDYSLMSGDTLIILSQQDVRYLNSVDVQNALAGKNIAALIKEASNTGRREGGRSDDKNPETLADLKSSDEFAASDERQSLDEMDMADSRRSQRRRQSSEDDITQAEDATADMESTRRPSTQCNGLIELLQIRTTERANRFANAVRGINNQRNEIIAGKQKCPDIFRNEFGDLLPYLLEKSVEVTGEVRRPGIFPIADDLNLAALLKLVGGLSREADDSRVAISRFEGLNSIKTDAPAEQRKLYDIAAVAPETILLKPADRINVHPKFNNRDDGPVQLVGEFKYPGTYEIARNTRLSEIIARAGGITETAYPYGAVVTRESARREEERTLERFKKELQDSLAYGITSGGEKGAAAATAAPFLKSLLDDVNKTQAIGRIVVEADPNVLQARQELDPALQPGDRIFMPKRPSTVSVTGEVLNAGSFQFIAGASAKSYIQKAGSFRESADKGKAFVIFPDGTAKNLEFSAWRADKVSVPPGSAIVVPRDLTPLNFLTLAAPLTQIISQLAVTAASLSVISSN